MSPIGRPHNPAATSPVDQRGGAREQAVAGSDRPAAAPPADEQPAADDHQDGPDAPLGAPGSAEPAEPGRAEPPPAGPAPAEEPAVGPAATTPGPGEPAPPPPPASVDDLLRELAAVRAERDEYLELARAKQAELENFRKQVMKRQADHLQQAEADLVTKLLPVLDALDNGIGHGDESLVPVRAQLVGVLEKDGLRRVDPADAPFDPNEHDAVAHEAGDGGEATVAETLRAGYWWNGRLLRAAMVKVRG